ncbi:hypothetical protein NA78x_005590 [Anatilimnocola sp. NA78]|uniref:hypothetical protein n=1 Tax=Anatilimnocola sp. NA78 TaxID=3415683 RepID=UPI003CE54F14
MLRFSALTWVIFLAVVGAPLAVGYAAEPLSDARIQQAIEQLGDASFDVREAAQKELLKNAEAAEKQLLEATRSLDLERSRRAQFILSALGEQKLNALMEKVTWSVLLERIREHAKGTEWQKPGWTDPLIEGAVTRLVTQANRAATAKTARMPVKFAECISKPAGPPGFPGRGGPGEMVCARGSHEVSFANNSVYLIDGSIRIAHASNCVIIARGAVNISHGSGNIVLAGHYIDVAHEGSMFGRPGAEMVSSSLLMSGGLLRISHAQGAICSTPGLMELSGSKLTFLNSPNVSGSHHVDCEKVEAKLQIVPVAPPSPISDKLTITQVINRGDSEKGLVILEQGGVEIVLRPNTPITDNLGKPISALEGWKLEFVGDRFALFSNGETEASFLLPRR